MCTQDTTFISSRVNVIVSVQMWKSFYVCTLDSTYFCVGTSVKNFICASVILFVFVHGRYCLFFCTRKLTFVRTSVMNFFNVEVRLYLYRWKPDSICISGSVIVFVYVNMWHHLYPCTRDSSCICVCTNLIVLVSVHSWLFLYTCKRDSILIFSRVIVRVSVSVLA